MVYYTFSDYLKQRYGEKVYKLPIALPLTCPNRDGTCGVNGCTFCGSIGTGYENLPSSMSVTQQITANKAHIIPKYKAKKFIAYLQNFSNTYLPINDLIRYAEEATHDENIVALYIATRPDCINEYYLARLNDLKEHRHIDICIELGLQTVNYKSLIKINRGHTLAEFIDAVLRIKQYNIQTCAHIILNLPWDDMTDVIETAKIMSALRLDQVKLHALYIIKNTVMAEQYLNNEIKLISLSEYKQRVITFLEYLSPDIVLQRLIGRAPAENTLFSNWHTGWWKIRDEIIAEMENKNLQQGLHYNYLNGQALKKFIAYN
ncbi:TIGR01212 family radical SAM protein [Pectinatus frisingensis]|uniref:TIGR01212 family radical SAM protein n=1 Tax=Pectinatus frisingensis TaxID=865 RepID=UPI0018C7D924|nr:TIGR01212 family radical SAM protein [Pectinatus frisingensis]